MVDHADDGGDDFIVGDVKLFPIVAVQIATLHAELQPDLCFRSFGLAVREFTDSNRKRIGESRVPLLAELFVSVQLRQQHCLPRGGYRWETRKQCRAAPSVNVFSGKQWHTDSLFTV